MNKIKLLVFTGIIVLISACGSEKGSDGCNSNYDQQALFVNIADNLILPSILDLKNSVSNLEASIIEFNESTTTLNLNAVKSDFRSSYLDWQQVEYFNFGPSEAIQLNTKMNNFPVNAALLEANIAAGQYNLDSPDNYYSGFPALDYLLYGTGANESEILNLYINNPEYQAYLLGVVELMKDKIDFVHSEWTNNYRDEFITNEGTADGTSISLMINSINENFENTRRERLGIPAGFHDINVPAFPERAEAYYSSLSLELLKENMSSALHYFKGLNGEGIDDYLEFAGATKENVNLEDAIINQFEAIISNLGLIPETLATSVEDHADLIQDAYVPLANQVVLLKTDTPSALCVSITYIDNASDSD